VRRIHVSVHPLALIIGAYLVLGLVYSTTIPLFEAPDEQLHFAYVQYLATGNGLPVQSLDHPAPLARQEGSQPPLYYLLAAGATFWINTTDFPGIVWENPHYGYDVPGIVNDNKNLFIHTSRENFPYRGATLAMHIARLVSLLLGAVAVLFTYRLTIEIFPNFDTLALSSAALVAFVPQFLLVSSAVSNDSAIVAMSAVSLWLIARLLLHEPRPHDAAVVGAATGLAALAKVSGLGLAFLAAAVMVFVLRGNLRRMAKCLITMFSFFAVVAGWWYLRNWILYGEVTGTEMMLHIFGARQTPLNWTQFAAQLQEVWETFWIGFGWGNIRAQPIVYTLIAFTISAGAIGFAAGAARRRHVSRKTLQKALPLGLLVVWIALVSSEFLRWMMLTQAPHGRLLFPALPALMPLLSMGLSQLAPVRFRRLPAPVFASGLFALAAASPFLLIAPAYAYPLKLTAADTLRLEHRVDINYDGKVKLLGFDLSPERAQPGGSIQLELYWQSLAAMDRDYSIGIHILDPMMRVIGARDSFPGHGLLPTSLWQVGEIFRDEYWIPIAANSKAPSAAEIQIALYDRNDQTDLTALDPNGQTITPIVGRFPVDVANPSPVEAEHLTRYSFGRVISLSGYDSRMDSSLGLTFYWERVGPVSTDYTVFVHVLDANGEIVSQRDQQPMEGAYPTSLWREGETVADRYLLQVPRTAAQIELGLYDATAGTRLQVSDDRGRTLGDHVVLPLPNR
jgi:4-amino-4-deoxy-L-arabinose transferase-like glycosyltransferase